jgi:hypothetical protein
MIRDSCFHAGCVNLQALPMSNYTSHIKVPKGNAEVL